MKANLYDCHDGDYLNQICPACIEMKIELLKERCAICDDQLRLIIQEDDPEAIIRYDKYFINCCVCNYTTKKANSKREAAQNYFDLMIFREQFNVKIGV